MNYDRFIDFIVFNFGPDEQSRCPKLQQEREGEDWDAEEADSQRPFVMSLHCKRLQGIAEGLGL